MRRWRIPGDNIVSLLHGIARSSCSNQQSLKSNNTDDIIIIFL